MYFSSRLRIKNGLVTISRVETNPSLTKAKIFITVYPEAGEKEVKAKLKHLKKGLIEYIKKNFAMKRFPRLEFEISREEKNRIKIEKLLAKI